MTLRFALLALLAATGAVAAPVPYTPPTVGSGNTAIADPGVARPATTPCRVRLFTDQPFADFSPKFFAYGPPAACPGPWPKVVLDADYSVEAGRQIDRTPTPWISRVHSFFRTPPAPPPTLA